VLLVVLHGLATIDAPEAVSSAGHRRTEGGAQSRSGHADVHVARDVYYFYHTSQLSIANRNDTWLVINNLVVAVGSTACRCSW
jgi:hypothetical protein